jgi:benzoate-CoA ligase
MYYLVNRPGRARPGSCGQPVPGYTFRLVGDDGNDVPPREAGILAIHGPTLLHHYARRPEATRKAFQGEWFLSGDMFRRDADGYYWFQGRKDDLLKVAGAWVSPAEVENVLMAHPAVLECAVVGAPDDAGTTRPKAFVVLQPGVAAGAGLPGEILALAKERLAPYKVPRWVEFVPELPKTSTGKTQRFKLRSASVPSPPEGGRAQG